MAIPPLPHVSKRDSGWPRRWGGRNLENRIRMADGWGALALFETPQAAKLVSLPLHIRAGPVRGHTSPSLCSFSEVAPYAASRGALALFETPQAAKLVSLPLHIRAGPVRGHTSPSLCSFSEVAPYAASRAKALEAIVSALLRRVRHYRLRRGRVLKTLVKRPPPKIGGVLRHVNHSATRPPSVSGSMLRRVRHYRLRRGRVLKTLVKRPPPKIGGVLRHVNHSATRPPSVSGSRPLRTAYRERREPGEPVATASRRRARRGA